MNRVCENINQQTKDTIKCTNCHTSILSTVSSEFRIHHIKPDYMVAKIISLKLYCHIKHFCFLKNRSALYELLILVDFLIDSILSLLLQAIHLLSLFALSQIEVDCSTHSPKQPDSSHLPYSVKIHLLWHIGYV